MGAARQKDQADFDLERFIDMFDEALNSRDERVTDALQSLMMMVILTKSEDRRIVDRDRGPLRRMYEDLHHMNRRLNELDDMVRTLAKPAQSTYDYKYDYNYKHRAALDALSANMAREIDKDVLKSMMGPATFKNIIK
jgi:hypothetical protein